MTMDRVLRRCTWLVRAAAVLIVLAAAAGDALAQRPPYRERPEGYARDDRVAGQHTPGVFDYYLLVLSWSPTYCADVGEARRDPQCAPRHDRPFAFAGLWEHWDGNGGEMIESCTIITTDANDAMAELHDRMPVILAPDDYDQWLDPKVDDKESLQPLLKPCPDDWLAFRPVSTRVNNPRHDAPDCVNAVDVQGDLF